MSLYFNDLVGKTVIVNLSYIDMSGKFLTDSEYYGTIVEASQTHGIIIERYGINDKVALPPQLDNFHPAPPGQYHLQKAQITVTNPDFVSNWRVTVKKSKKND